MPIGSVKTAADEAAWEEAKREARASKPDDFYALAMHIFQAMKKGDRLPGGRADKKTPADFDADVLAEGAKHELEHTDDKELAREIAMDHLAEDARYYVRLQEVEAEKVGAKKSANPVTREDVSPVDASPDDDLDRRAEAEDRKRPRFVIGSKPSPIGKSERPDDRRERNAKPHNRAARRNYMKTEEGRAANRTAQANYRRDHPDRVAAQHAARTKHGESKDAGHKCAVCAKPATHKHHAEGYGAGKGDSIRWLCHEHHVKAHHPKSNLGEKSMNAFHISSETKQKLFAAFGVDPLRKSDEKKEKSMHAVFEQIMKGAISNGVVDAGAADRLGAVELKRAIAQQEMTYAKCLQRAAAAEELIASLKKGMPPWLKDKKDGEGKDGEASGKDDEAKGKKAPPFGKKDEAEKAGVGLPRQAGIGASMRGADEDDDENAEKSLLTIGQTEGEAGLHKAIEEAFRRATAAKDRVRQLSKALSTVEHGEAGQAGAGAIGASQTSAELGGSAGAGDTSNAEPFDSGSMNGMPSVDAGRAVQLSDDDREVNAQMSDGQSALEGAVPHGSAELVSSVGQVMGGDASHGSGMAKSDLAKSQEARRARETGPSLPRQDYGTASPQRATGEGQPVRQSMVHYSSSEDVRISNLMQKSNVNSIYGGAQGEPTLDVRAPLLKSLTCGLCKSSVPAMFSVCPSCGNDHTTGHVGAPPATMLSKSVKERITGSVPAPCYLPNGVLVLPND